MDKAWVVKPLFLESDQEIVFESGVVIAACESEFQGGSDSLFTARNKDNIALRGYGAKLVIRKGDYRQPLI